MKTCSDKSKKIRDAEGKRSRETNLWNRRNVLMLIGFESEEGNGGISFYDLKKETYMVTRNGKGFSRQTLAKHIHKLKEHGLIFEDTVKPWDNLVYDSGQVIFKARNCIEVKFIFESICLRNLVDSPIETLLE
jgi:hypothetical protein